MKTSEEFVSPILEVASDDSSSLNRRSMSLNTEAWKAKWRVERGFTPESLTGASFCAVKAVMTIPTANMTKQQRRELRKLLREELNKVQGLSSKLEARELQLKRQSQSTGVYPTLSDAQFSGNDVRSSSGKEVTSQLVLSSPGLSQRDAGLLKQRSFIASDSTTSEADLSHHKRAPKANQTYHSSDFVLGKEKISSPLDSTLKPAIGSKRRVDGKELKRKPVEMQSKQNLEFLGQCRSILQKLMGHKDGWVFNHPVDAVKLGLPDYHLVIKEPMDLGTIKAKLDRKEYTTPIDFAKDVRLTFNNAMTYNPPGNDVHQMADELKHLFEEKFKVINEKLEKTDGEGEVEVLNKSLYQLSEAPRALAEIEEVIDQSQPKVSKKKTLNNNSAVAKPKTPSKPKPPTKPKAPAKPKATTKPQAKGKPKRQMTFQEKAQLSHSLSLVPSHMLDYALNLMKERNPNMSQKDDEIEVEIDSFDNETLWELDRYIKNCLKTVEKSKKAAEQKGQPMGNDITQNPNNNQKGELCEEDIDIVDDVPRVSPPGTVVNKHTGSGSRSVSSGSSSTDSESSGDSDSGSSSGSESDADDNLMC